MKDCMFDDDHSISTLQDAIDKEPINYWLWHDLCGLHIAANSLNGAIHACEIGIKQSGKNPSPLLELTNLYVAKGDYSAAVTTGMQLLKIKPAILLMALRDPKEFLITPT